MGVSGIEDVCILCMINTYVIGHYMSGFVFNVTTGYPFRIDTWRTLFSKYPIITQFYRNFQSVSYSLGCYLALSTITLLE